jgi:hypothetical protein
MRMSIVRKSILVRVITCKITDYFFDKKKVQLFFTLEFHAAVRGE